MIDWQKYQYEKLDKNVYSLLTEFLDDKKIKTAIDLGCGSGNETVYMLNKGIKVLAIDSELNKDYVLDRVEESFKNNVSFIQADFNDVDLPKSDLIIAFFSLPFCIPEKFESLWNKVFNAINKDGYLICQLFGNRDFRQNFHAINTFTKKEIGRLLNIYDVLKIEEKEYEKEDKHWHYYNIIVQKK